MNLRHRWWMAGAILCLSAAGMQRARGEELPLAPRALPAGAPVESREQQAGEGPADRVFASTATASVAQVPDSQVPALLQAAESAYRLRQVVQAAAGFERVLAFDPLNAQAWLRLGNLHQQAGREAEAIDAYRNAALTVPESDAAALARGKALLNIALLGVAAASRALDDLDASGLAALKPERDATAGQLGATRRRVARAGAGLAEPPVSATPSSSRSLAREAPAAPADFQPYTVDRWIATPRKAPHGRSGARPSVREPLTETPLPPAPIVDTIQGVQRRPAGPEGGAR